jgi:hypothetical protein
MPTLWMGVRPLPTLTRLLVQDGPIPILKARLPEAPHHPRALETLAEGVALWYGRPLYAVLGVAAEDALCVSPRWHATVEGLIRTPLVTMPPSSGAPDRAWRRRRHGHGTQDARRVRARVQDQRDAAVRRIPMRYYRSSVEPISRKS